MAQHISRVTLVYPLIWIEYLAWQNALFRLSGVVVYNLLLCTTGLGNSDRNIMSMEMTLHSYLVWFDKRQKAASIEDVHKIFGFLTPSHLSAFGTDLYYKILNLPNYIYFSMIPSPLRCRHHIWMPPMTLPTHASARSALNLRFIQSHICSIVVALIFLSNIIFISFAIHAQRELFQISLYATKSGQFSGSCARETRQVLKDGDLLKLKGLAGPVLRGR